MYRALQIFYGEPVLKMWLSELYYYISLPATWKGRKQKRKYPD